MSAAAASRVRLGMVVPFSVNHSCLYPKPRRISHWGELPPGRGRARAGGVMRARFFVLAALAVLATFSIAAFPPPAHAQPRCAVKAPAGLVAPGTLTVGTAFGTPPQNFLVDNKPTGSDVEIMQAIADQMCLKADFVNLAFDGLFPGLNAKKFDTIAAAVGITAQRQ